MSYVFLLISILLLVLTSRDTFRYFSEDPEPIVEKGGPDYIGDDILGCCQELEKKLDILTARVENYNLRDTAVLDQIQQLNQRFENGHNSVTNSISDNTTSFSGILDDSRLKWLCNYIYQAYDAGKDVTQIASELNRGKGEIELILNLRC